jgi:hypothetical protein
MRKPNTLSEAAKGFMEKGEAYIIAGPTPEGGLGFSYQGSPKQLTAMLFHIQVTLLEDEGIGKHIETVQ